MIKFRTDKNIIFIKKYYIKYYLYKYILKNSETTLAWRSSMKIVVKKKQIGEFVLRNRADLASLGLII